MGVYSMNNDVELELGTSVEECAYEPGIEAAWAIVAESEQNYNAIMQAIGVEELAVYESTGEEMVYEAGNVSGFFGKVKEFFLKMWEKIKGLFKKFFAMFDTFVKNDKDFVNKYKAHLAKIDTRNFEYKGFKYTKLDLDLTKVDATIEGVIPVKMATPTTVEAANKALKNAENREVVVERMRGAIIAGENSLSASEFSKELFKMFRNNEDSKETIEGVNVTELLMNISGNSKLRKDAEKAYKELEKTIKKEIKDLEKAEKELVKSMPEAGELRAKQIRHANNVIAFKKEKMNILNVVNGAKLTAIKDYNRQSKAMCVALMNYKPKNESFGFGDDGYVAENGFLSGVVLR